MKSLALILVILIASISIASAHPKHGCHRHADTTSHCK
jgi:hypothetical protein